VTSTVCGWQAASPNAKMAKAIIKSVVFLISLQTSKSSNLSKKFVTIFIWFFFSYLRVTSSWIG
jgi:hypothetical protein